MAMEKIFVPETRMDASARLFILGLGLGLPLFMLYNIIRTYHPGDSILIYIALAPLLLCRLAFRTGITKITLRENKGLIETVNFFGKASLHEVSFQTLTGNYRKHLSQARYQSGWRYVLKLYDGKKALPELIGVEQTSSANWQWNRRDLDAIVEQLNKGGASIEVGTHLTPSSNKPTGFIKKYSGIFSSVLLILYFLSRLWQPGIGLDKMVCSIFGYSKACTNVSNADLSKNTFR